MLEEESLRLLSMKGLNPLIITKASKLKAIMFIVLDNITAVLIILGLFNNTLETYNIVDNWNAATISYQIVIKETVLLIYKTEFAQAIYCLKDFWQREKFGEGTLRRIVNIQDTTIKLLRVFRSILLITTILYLLKPFYEKKLVLPLTWLSFCDIKRSALCYIFNYVLQALCIANALHTMVGFDGMFFILLSYGYCELEQIKYAFVNLKTKHSTDGHGQEDVLKQVADLVKQHNLVLRYIDMIHKLFRNLLLCQFPTSLAALCTGLFLLTAKGFPPSVSLMLRYLPYILCALCQIFIYCVAGQKIADQTQSIAQAAYEMKWFTMEPNVRKMLCLIIVRSQKRIQITAGGIWNLDMSTFVSILKSSMSALTLMQTLYNTE